MDDVFRSYILPVIIGSVTSVFILVLGWFFGIYQMRKTIQNDNEKLEKMVKHEVSENSKKLTIQYITDKRVEWIYEVRETVSMLLSELYYVSSTYKANAKRVPIPDLKEINYLHAKLRLLFNFTGDLDSKIIELSHSVIRSVNKRDFDKKKFLRDMMSLSEMTQIYLKLEWDRVKIEAGETSDKVDIDAKLESKKKYLLAQAKYVGNDRASNE